MTGLGEVGHCHFLFFVVTPTQSTRLPFPFRGRMKEEGRMFHPTTNSGGKKKERRNFDSTSAVKVSKALLLLLLLRRRHLQSHWHLERGTQDEAQQQSGSLRGHNGTFNLPQSLLLLLLASCLLVFILGVLSLITLCAIRCAL